MCSSGTDIVSEPPMKNSLELYSVMDIILALSLRIALDNMMIFVHNHADIRGFFR